MRVAAFSDTAATATLSVTATTGSVTFNVNATAPSPHARVYNQGTKDCYIKFGNSAVTAAVTDMPVKAGSTFVFNCHGQKYIAAICGGTDTTTLLITPGEGGI